MSRKYFGTDGIRGTVGEPPITPDFVLRLAHAVGRVLKRTEERPTVLIGKDTRISGYMLESALESGFNSAGVDVVLLGPAADARRGLPHAGAARQPGRGDQRQPQPLPRTTASSSSARRAPSCPTSGSWTSRPRWRRTGLGRLRHHRQGAPARRRAGRYIEFCKSTFANDLTLKGMKIAVDAAHGAAYHIAPKVFHELGAEVFCLGCSPDGLNINDKVGATHPEALVAAVRANRADFGIALDGDADRLQMVDADGRLFNGDELLYLMVMDRQAQGYLPSSHFAIALRCTSSGPSAKRRCGRHRRRPAGSRRTRRRRRAPASPSRSPGRPCSAPPP
jgi:phosphoglucosamine mutase